MIILEVMGFRDGSGTGWTICQQSGPWSTHFTAARPMPAYQTHGRRETKDSGVSKWYGAEAVDVSAAGR